MSVPDYIRIDVDDLLHIIHHYCSCGGRGPDDDPCDACSIYHVLMQRVQHEMHERGRDTYG